jgi:hypothetical protein
MINKRNIAKSEYNAFNNFKTKEKTINNNNNKS